MTSSLSLLDQLPQPRPGLLEISSYKGGAYQVEGEGRILRLASNEAALGPSPKAVAAYQKTSAMLDRYPDSYALMLRQAIAEQHGLDPTRIVCGAGSDEILQLLGRAYAGPGDEIIHSAHGFALYPIIARSTGATPISVAEKNLTADVEALLAAVTERTRIVFLANPNNPTGTYLPIKAIRRLHAGLPRQVILVLDAAYAEYVDLPDYEAGIDLVTNSENLVMTRTFSKIYGLAALRIGWCYAPAAIVDILHRIRGPFNVSAPAQAAAVAAIHDQAHIARAKAQARRVRLSLTQRLHGLESAARRLVVHDSVANFLLVEFPNAASYNAQAALKFLTEQRILVRDARISNLPNHLRIGLGPDPDMIQVGDALDAFLNRTDT